MTRLIKLSLKNFKSFKRAEIPISTGFSAIIGSNGSGKSNILDALLFVLGITSLKTLRAGKLTDLVNHNSKEKYAKVDLLLKDGEKKYEISRMIDNQGKSIYRLDGKRTTLNEITSLLIELRIDVDGHNIVTQGDITKIIEMNPIQRREIIDSTAGLSEFDSKKEEAIKELDKVNSRIKDATIILNERNEFLNDLEEEMKSAKEYNTLEEEKKRTKTTIFEKELYLLEKKTIEINKELTILNKQKNELEEKTIQNRKELQEAKHKSSTLSNQILKASEETYTSIGREYEEKKAKLNLETEKINLNKHQLTKNNEKIESNKEEIKIIEQKLSELNEKISETVLEQKENENELIKVVESKNKLENIVKEKNIELEKKENQLIILEKELNELQKEYFNTNLYIKNFEKQKSFNEKNIQEIIIEEKKTREELNIIENKKNQLKELLNQHPEKELIELETKITELLEKKSGFVGKRNQEEKYLLELKKISSKCPTCESTLNENTKTNLLTQKKEVIQNCLVKEEELIKSINESKIKIVELKEKIKLASKLEIETSSKENITTKLNELITKKEVIEKELNQEEFEEKTILLKKQNQEITELIEEINKEKEFTQTARKQNIFEEYSKITRNNEELLSKQNTINSNLNENKSKLEYFLNKKEEYEINNNSFENELIEINKEIKEKEKNVFDLKEEVIEKEKILIEAKKKNAILSDEKNYLDKKIDKLDKELWSDSTNLKKIESRISEFSVEQGRIEVKQNDLIEEKKGYEGIIPYTSKSLEECKEKIIFIENRLKEIGAVNLKAVDNFNELKKEVDEIQLKANQLSDERLAVLDMIDKIDIKRTNVFMECFTEINKNFKEIFFNFFGGEGNLNFQNLEKPLESGLIIEANHKGKRLVNIDSMSGGEKTLTALAFTFAIQLYKPAPFYAFDEADAALDKPNSLKMSKLIEKIAEKSQFIAITHNDVLTKKAHQIIGVAVSKENSSLIGLKLKNTTDNELKELEKYESRNEYEPSEKDFE